MMDDSIVSLVIFGLTSVSFVNLGMRLMRKKFPPNGLYGFRTAATLQDESLWYEVNAKLGQDLIGIGVSLAVLAVVLQVSSTSAHVRAILCGGWLLLGGGTAFAHGRLVIRQHKQR
jgi:hypothetical protein